MGLLVSQTSSEGRFLSDLPSRNSWERSTCGVTGKVSVANPWLRLYAEIRRDPKVRTMPETFQLRLIWLLTLRCEGMTEKMSSEELMYGLDCDETTLQKIHETFLQKGFIEKNWAVVNWDKRQYISDSSTPRVKKYRANKAMKQGETFQKQFHETHETQNETDQNRTEQNRTKKNTKSEFEEIYQAYPKHEGKLDALKAIEKAVRSNGHDASWYLERVRVYAAQTKGSDPKFIPLPATWFNKGHYYNESLDPKPTAKYFDPETGEELFRGQL